MMTGMKRLLPADGEEGLLSNWARAFIGWIDPALPNNTIDTVKRKRILNRLNANSFALSWLSTKGGLARNIKRHPPHEGCGPYSDDISAAVKTSEKQGLYMIIY
jgi:hypothetical protein